MAIPRWGYVLAATFIALVALFWDALGDLWIRWGGQQELSHSYFIPVISAWLVWQNKDVLKSSIGEPSWVGLLLGFGAMLLYFVGHLTQSYIFQQAGIVFVIAGLTAGFGGVSLLRAAAAPILFLFLAVPPPFWFITVLSWKFQLISSVIGVEMIEMMGIPVYLSGNIIDLGEYKLAVAEACSGLRYLFPFLSLGVMTAFLFQGPLWQRLTLVAATVPITILMNSFRIAFTGALVQAFGPSHAEGALHFFEGWVVFLLCMLVLFGIIWLFSHFSTPRKNAFDLIGSPELKPITPSKANGNQTAILGGIGVLAIAFLGAAQIVTVDEFIKPPRKDFANIPGEFPEWNYEIKPISENVAEVLGADDSIVVNLVSPDAEQVNLYFAYLDARRDGRSWHSPRQCIPGGGWRITSHTIESYTLPDGKELNYNRLMIENRGHRQLVYYWYDQRGRKVANEFVMKLWLIRDAIFRKRSDGAMLRLLTPVSDEGGIEEAEATLERMVDRISGFIPEYVPE